MQEVGFPTRNEVEGGRRPVCTSAARKIGVPLAGARDGVPQQACFPWLCAERMNLRVCTWGGRCGKERPAEEGVERRQLDRRQEQGGNVLPQNCALCGIMGGIMTL